MNSPDGKKIRVRDFKLIDTVQTDPKNDLNQSIQIFDILYSLVNESQYLSKVGFFAKTGVQRIVLIFLAAEFKEILSSSIFETEKSKVNFISKILAMEFPVKSFNIEILSDCHTKLGLAIEFKITQDFFGYVQAKSRDENLTLGTFENGENIYGNNWTEERLALLVGLWEQGLSISAIGKKLGVTRNAIAGKAHRLQLPKRDSIERKKKLYTSSLNSIRADTLMELSRAIFRRALVKGQSNLKSDVIRANRDAILVTLGALDENKKFRDQLINSYLSDNDNWKTFKRTFPELLLPILPDPTSSHFNNELEKANKRFGERFNNLTKAKKKKRFNLDNLNENKAASLNISNLPAEESFEEKTSLWLEGLERREVTRVYRQLTDLSEVFSENKAEKNKILSKSSENSGQFNEDYKSLLDSSINPVMDSSLNSLYEFYQKNTDENSKNAIEKKYQQVEVRSEQSKFRKQVLEAYSNKCCVSGYSVEPALHAAHIQDYSVSGDNSLKNGLSLRADIHILFDRGLIKIHPNYLIWVSNNLKDTAYWEYNGCKIDLPNAELDWPAKHLLLWKADGP